MRPKRRMPGLWETIFVDVMITVLVVFVVFTMIAGRYNHIIKATHTGVSAFEAVSLWKPYMMAYHAINGEWPEKMEDMVPLYISKDDPQVTGLVEGGGEYFTHSGEIRITPGAMDIVLKEPLKGEVLTVHPAVPLEDPFGPVKWVAGGSAPEGWALSGEDHTTVGERYIVPQVFKR